MCIKARNRATERQPCTESCLCQLLLLLNPSGCDGDCSEQLEERRRFFISPPASLLCLWSPSLFSFFYRFFRLFPIVLCSFVHLELCSCCTVTGRCVYMGVCRSQIKLLFIFGARDHFQVSAPIVIHYTIFSFKGKKCNTSRSLCLYVWIDVRVCALHLPRVYLVETI